MKSDNRTKPQKDRIKSGKRNARRMVGLGLFPPILFMLYDLAVDQGGYAIAFLILFVPGLIIGVSMAEGSSTARWIWALCGFVLSILLFLATAISAEDTHSPLWILLLFAALLTFFVSMASINNKDIEAYFDSKKASVDHSNMEKLIDELGNKTAQKE